MLFGYYDEKDGNVIAELYTETETEAEATASEGASLFTEEEVAEIKELSREASEEIYKETSTDAEFNFDFNVDALMSSFSIMGKGMLGIFGVTIMIVLVVAVMNKLLSAKK